MFLVSQGNAAVCIKCYLCVFGLLFSGKLVERTIMRKFGVENVNDHFISFNTICDATQVSPFSFHESLSGLSHVRFPGRKTFHSTNGPFFCFHSLFMVDDIHNCRRPPTWCCFEAKSVFLIHTRLLISLVMLRILESSARFKASNFICFFFRSDKMQCTRW